MNLSNVIDTSDKVEEKLEEFQLELLQHNAMINCGVTSKRDSEILEEVNSMYERIQEMESNGEDHTISKGLIEIFLREWNIIKLGE